MLRMGKLCLVVAILSLVAVGCGRDAADLHGSWKVDMDKAMADMKSSDDYKKAKDEEKKFMEELKQGIFEKMEMTFAENKVTVSGGEGDKKDESDFKITSQDGDKWAVEVTTKKGDKTKTDKGNLEWVDDDHITMSIEGQKEKFHLVRKK